MEDGNAVNMVTAQSDESAKVSKISSIWLAMLTRWGTWRSKALMNYEYVVGNQLSKDTREKLARQKRPALVFNLLNPLVVYIAGTLISNKTIMKAVPVRMGDEQTADMHGVLVGDWAIPFCDGYEEIAKAGLDAAITGFGWLNNRWDVKRNPEGMWITEASDPLMIMFDPDGRKKDQSDWRYYAVSGWYSAEEIIGLHKQHLTPEMEEKIKERAKILEGRFESITKPIGWINRAWNSGLEFLGIREKREDTSDVLSNDFIDAKHGIYRVIEFHDRRMVNVKMLYDIENRERIRIPNSGKNIQKDDEGNVIASSDEQKAAEIMQQHPAGFIYETMAEELWITAVAPGLYQEAPLFELPYEVQDAGWQHKLITCYDFHPDPTKVVSITDPVKDPQDSYNQRRMTTLELLMDMVNPPTEAPVGSIGPDDEEAWTSKERGTIRLFKPIGMLKPERVFPNSAAITGLAAFGEEDKDLTSKLTGATPNLQGFSETSNEAASTVAQRIQQGMVMLNYFFSNLQRTQKQVFRYCDRSLQTFMDMPRAVRILGEPVEGMPGVVPGKEGYYWLQLNYPTLEGVLNDVKQGEYDFLVDSTHLGPTQKMIQRAEAMQFIKSVPPNLILWPELFKLWDSPVAPKMAGYAQKMMQMSLQANTAAQEKGDAAGDIALLEKANALKNNMVMNQIQNKLMQQR